MIFFCSLCSRCFRDARAQLLMHFAAKGARTAPPARARQRGTRRWLLPLAEPRNSTGCPPSSCVMASFATMRTEFPPCSHRVVALAKPPRSAPTSFQPAPMLIDTIPPHLMAFCATTRHRSLSCTHRARSSRRCSAACITARSIWSFWAGSLSEHIHRSPQRMPRDL